MKRVIFHLHKRIILSISQNEKVHLLSKSNNVNEYTNDTFHIAEDSLAFLTSAQAMAMMVACGVCRKRCKSYRDMRHGQAAISSQYNYSGLKILWYILYLY